MFGLRDIRGYFEFKWRLGRGGQVLEHLTEAKVGVNLDNLTYWKMD